MYWQSRYLAHSDLSQCTPLFKVEMAIFEAPYPFWEEDVDSATMGHRRFNKDPSVRHSTTYSPYRSTTTTRSIYVIRSTANGEDNDDNTKWIDHAQYRYGYDHRDTSYHPDQYGGAYAIECEPPVHMIEGMPYTTTATTDHHLGSILEEDEEDNIITEPENKSHSPPPLESTPSESKPSEPTKPSPSSHPRSSTTRTTTQTTTQTNWAQQKHSYINTRDNVETHNNNKNPAKKHVVAAHHQHKDNNNDNDNDNEEEKGDNMYRLQRCTWHLYKESDKIAVEKKKKKKGSLLGGSSPEIMVTTPEGENLFPDDLKYYPGGIGSWADLVDDDDDE